MNTQCTIPAPSNGAPLHARTGWRSRFTVLAACAAAFVCTLPAHSQEWLDRIDQLLTVSLKKPNFSFRVSGTLDLELYHTQAPAPGLIYTDKDWLVNPRLSVYVDAQFGPYVYGFAQARVDRGFDPTDGGSETRLDEYAVRISPWEDGRFSLQIGRFSTVVGNWVTRHGSWDNPFITAPSPYENLTGVWDYEPAYSPSTLLDWGHVLNRDSAAYEYSDKYERLPIIWGPAYTTGISVSGKIGKFEYAAEMKNANISSRPASWSVDEVNFDHPAYAARIAYRPDPAWCFGLSGATGPYLRPEAEHDLPAGKDIGDYRQLVLASDISYAHGHLQIWAEFFASRYEMPYSDDADTFAYFIEAKYKFSPQWFGALRWNQQFYGDIRNEAGQDVTWGQDLYRVDMALGVRPTEHIQLKLQYSLEHRDNAAREWGSLFASQFTLKF